MELVDAIEAYFSARSKRLMATAEYNRRHRRPRKSDEHAAGLTKGLAARRLWE